MEVINFLYMNRFALDSTGRDTQAPDREFSRNIDTNINT